MGHDDRSQTQLRALLDIAERGGTVVTANKRLSRALKAEYAILMAGSGRDAWQSPDIVTVGTFVRRLWGEYLEAAGGDGQITVLSPAQEASMWMEIISASPQGRDLLQLSSTVESAAEAYRLLCDYEPDTIPGFVPAATRGAFTEWAAAFTARCKSGECVSPNRLCGMIIPVVLERRVALPAVVAFGGFDEPTPAQSGLIAAAGTVSSVVCLPLDDGAGAQSVTVAEFADEAAEFRAIAAWTRGILDAASADPESPAPNVAVVVSDLSRARRRIERLMLAALHPEASSLDQIEPADRLFNVSAPPPLSEEPVVRTALVFLDLWLGEISTDTAGALLRSPFLTGHSRNAALRARCDARLRKSGRVAVGCATLARIAKLHADRRFASAMAALDALRPRGPAGVPPTDVPTGWSRQFARILTVTGWARPLRNLTGREWQAVTALREALSGFESLSFLSGPISAGTAVSHFRRILSDTPFQAEGSMAPVQVLGYIEAKGLRFNHLWFAGLDDRRWPPPPHPNPFLQAEWQENREVPGVSVELSSMRAGEVTANLVSSATEVVLSYPTREGDAELRMSPILREYAADSPSNDLQERADAFWAQRVPPSVALEAFGDTNHPIAARGGEPGAPIAIPGGVGHLKEFASCPFRAFALHRLKADPLEDPSAGFDALDRGTILHDAMARFWWDVRTSAELSRRIGNDKAGASPGLRETAERAATGATDQMKRRNPEAGNVLLQLERERLVENLVAWAGVEAERTAPFSVAVIEGRAVDGDGPMPEENRDSRWELNVATTEEGRAVTVGARPDRIDIVTAEGEGSATPEDRSVIIDYKTGKRAKSAESLLGYPLAEPQLPAYCSCDPVARAGNSAAQIDSPTRGAAFAMTNPQCLKFTGLAEEGLGFGRSVGIVPLQSDESLPDEVPSWLDLRAAWREALAATALRVVAGDGRVDPAGSPSPCQYCKLQSLCRIHDIESASEIEEGDENGQAVE